VPRAPKACAGGCGERVTGRTYCPRCAKPSPSSLAAQDPDERRRRAAAVTAWVRTNGWTCPGWQRPPHESRDLTAAHGTAVANGGKHSQLTVLCRSCNSSQQLTPT